MKLRELITIDLIPLKTDLPVEIEHILIAEVVGMFHSRFYLAELPIIENKIRKRLRFYENLVN